VSTGIVDRGPCRDLPCKLAWDKTLRFTKRQKRSYTTEHPRMKRTVKKAFIILMSSAAGAASADDGECRNFVTFTANKSRNCFPPTRNKVQHEISHNIFAADQGLFLVFHILSTFRHPYPRFPLSPVLLLLLVHKTWFWVIWCALKLCTLKFGY
jgi:hypothetical protein